MGTNRRSNNADNSSVVLLIDFHHEHNKIFTTVGVTPQLPFQSKKKLRHASIALLSHPNSDEEQQFIQLPSIPTTNSSTSDSGCDLFEVQCLEGSAPTYRSFFVGSRVVSNGSLCVTTRVDPLFFALQALTKSHSSLSPSSNTTFTPTSEVTNSNNNHHHDMPPKKYKWQPVDQLLADIPKVVRDAIVGASSSSSSPDGNGVDNSSANQDQLKHLCETTDKFGDDMILYKYSPDRSLRWLQKKLDRIYKVMQTQMLDTNKMRSKLAQTIEKAPSRDGGSGAFHDTFCLAEDQQENTINNCEQGQDDALNNEASLAAAGVTALSREDDGKVREASLQVVCEYLSREWQIKFIQFALNKNTNNHEWNNALRSELKKVELPIAAGASDGASTGATYDESAANGEKRKAASWEAAPGAEEADELMQFAAHGSKSASVIAAERTKKAAAVSQSQGLKKLAKVSTKGMKSMASFFGGAPGSKKSKKK